MNPRESLSETTGQILPLKQIICQYLSWYSTWLPTHHNIPPLKANERKLLPRVNKIIAGQILDKLKSFL